MPAASSDPTRAAGPTRRSLLRVGLLALGVTAVAGCTDGRPRTPWSPDPDVDGDERLPPDLPPDGELLLLARERLHRYRAVLTHVRPVSRTGRSVARHLDDVLCGGLVANAICGPATVGALEKLAGHLGEESLDLVDP